MRDLTVLDRDVRQMRLRLRRDSEVYFQSRSPLLNTDLAMLQTSMLLVRGVAHGWQRVTNNDAYPKQFLDIRAKASGANTMTMQESLRSEHKHRFSYLLVFFIYFLFNFRSLSKATI